MSEASRTSGALPTPPSTASGSHQSRRARRQENSSTSESSMGTFDISNVKLRVITPPRPNPLVSYPHDDECHLVKRVFGSTFEDHALRIARESGIVPSHVRVNLTSRVFRDDPSDAQTAILIVVDEWTPSSPAVWEAVVIAVKKYIDVRMTNMMPAAPIEISVEMVAKDLVRRKYLSPLAVDANFPRLRTVWPDIQTGIFNILQRFNSTANHLTLIAISRLGFSSDFNNPTTVYIAVDYGSSEVTWPPVLDEMQKFIDEFRLDLHVHMEHNEIGHSAFELLKVDLTPAEYDERARSYNFELERPYLRAVPAGADIGTATYIKRDDGTSVSPLVGTLGCWVEVKVKDRGWQTLGLTNYHVVRPSLQGFTMSRKTVKLEPGKQTVLRSRMGTPVPGSVLWKADRDGLRTHDTSQRCQMEHPARAKHNFTVQGIQNRIRALEASGVPVPSELTSDLASMTSFFDGDQQHFGRPCFGSGYLKRSNGNGRLDWALIQPVCKERVGDNMLPSAQHWSAAGYAMDEGPLALGWPLSAQQRTIRTIGTEDRVFKIGASTKSTVGVYAGLQAGCIIAEERYMTERTEAQLISREYTFIGPRDKAFAHKGDSGAVVWDDKGGILGLLFRGLQPHQAGEQGYTFVTPIEDVFESIKKTSEGRIEEVRILAPQV